MKVGSIVIRCYEFYRMMEFWQNALHYVPKYPPSNGWVILTDPNGRGIFTLRIRKKKWNGWSAWVRLVTHGDMFPVMTLWCWRTPMVIYFVLFRNDLPDGLCVMSYEL
jgi:hypothetical protein